MKITELLEKKKEGILKIAAHYGVVRIRLFGSAAKDEANEASDIDFLVAFEPGRSLLDLIGFKQDVESLLGKKVDVVSEKGVSPYLRDQIFGGAIPL